MGLLNGSASVTRCVVTSRPDEPDFEQAHFEEIVPGSTIRERVGFVPFEPDADYRVGQHRWAFRVRVDVLKPDPTRVQERLKELVHEEKLASGLPVLSPRKVRQLRELAEEELLVTTTPRSRVIECCLDDSTLWVGTTAKTHIGTVLGLLYEIGVVSDFKAPWLDHGDESPADAFVEISEPWQSALGCRLARRMMDDPELMVEPVSGSARIATREARITLSGEIMNDLVHHISRGAQILSVKVASSDTSFRFDALNYRVSGLRIDTEVHEHWHDQLDERLEKIEEVYDLLDTRYEALRNELVTT